MSSAGRSPFAGFRDLPIFQGVLDRDGDLIGRLAEELEIVLGIRLCFESGELQHAQDTLTAGKGEEAAGLKPLYRSNLIGFRIEPSWAAERQWLVHLEDLAGS